MIYQFHGAYSLDKSTTFRIVLLILLIVWLYVLLFHCLGHLPRGARGRRAGHDADAEDRERPGQKQQEHLTNLYNNKIKLSNENYNINKHNINKTLILKRKTEIGQDLDIVVPEGVAPGYTLTLTQDP